VRANAVVFGLLVTALNELLVDTTGTADAIGSGLKGRNVMERIERAEPSTRRS
jgi:hypothetical protein